MGISGIDNLCKKLVRFMLLEFYLNELIKGNIMKYELKTEILGFEDLKNVELHKIDELFATLMTDNDVSFTLANPYLLREYSFDLPTPIKALLEINENSKIEVYCIVVVQNPLNESLVNFTAPLIFNTDNSLAAQAILAENENKIIEPLKSFVVDAS